MLQLSITERKSYALRLLPYRLLSRRCATPKAAMPRTPRNNHEFQASGSPTTVQACGILTTMREMARRLVARRLRTVAGYGGKVFGPAGRALGDYFETVYLVEYRQQYTTVLP